MESVTVVVPIFNEVGSIDRSLAEIESACSDGGLDYQIVCVEDGSDDGTRECLQSLRNPRVKVLFHERNRGYGASLKTGIQAADSEIIVIVDADGTYPFKRIPDLVAGIEGYDMVVGSREGRSVHVPLLRRPAKWFLRKLANYLTLTTIPDLNSGLRAMKKSVIDRFINILPDGFSFTTTITVAMLCSNYRVRYVPINYYKRVGKSKIRPIRDTLAFVQLVIKTVMYFNPMRVMLPLSLLFFAVSLGMLVYRIVVGQGFLVTSLFFFLAGTQVLTAAILADLITKKVDRN